MKTEDFQRIMGHDIGTFFQEFKLFCQTEYPLIVQYYQGGTMDATAFEKLNKLILQSEQIEGSFERYPSALTTLDTWELLDTFSEVQTKLATIKNSSKWLRSSRRDNISPSVSVERFLRTGENFERVSQDLGDQDSQNSWIDIAIPNYCMETDYTDEKGTLYRINLQNDEGLQVNNVVDNLVGETVLGKDVSKEFDFSGNDLAYVEYQSCIEQTLGTIIESVKGDFPEFPTYGIPSEMIGTNVNSLQYPTLIKSILNMFQRDSRWREVEVVEIKTEKDSTFMKLKCVTILNDVYTTNLKI